MRPCSGFLCNMVGPLGIAERVFQFSGPPGGHWKTPLGRGGSTTAGPTWAAAHIGTNQQSIHNHTHTHTHIAIHTHISPKKCGHAHTHTHRPRRRRPQATGRTYPLPRRGSCTAHSSAGTPCACVFFLEDGGWIWRRRYVAGRQTHDRVRC